MSDKNVVQYRDPDEAIAAGTTIVPKGDTAGRTVITADAPIPVAPVEPTPTGTPYRTSGPTFFENEAVIAAVPRVLEMLYIQVGAVLVNAAPLYPLIVDKAGAVVANDGSASPLPKISAVGDMVFWEPPGGFLFTAGLRVIVSSTPDIYTAPGGGAEPISVMARTRAP